MSRTDSIGAKKSRWGSNDANRQDSIQYSNERPRSEVEVIFGKPPPANSNSFCTRCTRSGHSEEKCWSITNVCKICGVVGHVEEVHEGASQQIIKDFCPRCTLDDHTADQCRQIDQKCVKCRGIGHIKKVHYVKDENLRKFITKTLGRDLWDTSFCPRCTRSGHMEDKCESIRKSFRCRTCNMVGHYKEVHSVTDQNLRQVIIEVLGVDLWNESNDPTLKNKDTICHRCARSGHSDDQCSSLFRACRKCGLVGHLSEVHSVEHIGFRQKITKVLGMDLWKGSSKMSNWGNDDVSNSTSYECPKPPAAPTLSKERPTAPAPPSLSALKNRGAHLSTTVPPPSLKFLSSVLDNPLLRPVPGSSVAPQPHASSSSAALYSHTSGSSASSAYNSGYSLPPPVNHASSSSSVPLYHDVSSAAAPISHASSSSAAPLYHFSSRLAAPQYHGFSSSAPTPYLASSSSAASPYLASSNLASPLQHSLNTPLHHTSGSSAASLNYASSSPAASPYPASSSSAASPYLASSSLAAPLQHTSSSLATPLQHTSGSLAAPVYLDGTGTYNPMMGSRNELKTMRTDIPPPVNILKNNQKNSYGGINNLADGLLGACPTSFQVPPGVWRAVPSTVVSKKKKKKKKSKRLAGVSFTNDTNIPKPSRNLKALKKLGKEELEFEDQKRREEELKLKLKRNEVLKEKQGIKEQNEEYELISESEEDEEIKIDELGQGDHYLEEIEDKRTRENNEKMMRLLELTRKEQYLNYAIEEEKRKKVIEEEEEEIALKLKERELERELEKREELLRREELDLQRREKMTENLAFYIESRHQKPDLKVEMMKEIDARNDLKRRRLNRQNEEDLKVQIQNELVQCQNLGTQARQQLPDLKVQMQMELSLQRSRSSSSKSPTVESPILSRRQRCQIGRENRSKPSIYDRLNVTKQDVGALRRSALDRLGGKVDFKSRLGGNLASNTGSAPKRSRKSERNRRNTNLDNEDRDHQGVDDVMVDYDDESLRDQERARERALKERLLRDLGGEKGERSKNEKGEEEGERDKNEKQEEKGERSKNEEEKGERSKKEEEKGERSKKEKGERSKKMAQAQAVPSTPISLQYPGDPVAVKCCLCNNEHTTMALCKHFQKSRVKDRYAKLKKAASCPRCLRLDAKFEVGPRRREWWEAHKPACNGDFACKEGDCATKPIYRQHHFLVCLNHITSNKGREAEFVETLEPPAAGNKPHRFF